MSSSDTTDAPLPPVPPAKSTYDQYIDTTFGGLTTMSAGGNPISPAAFTIAIKDLPIDTLHSKAAEIQNSIQHLRESNEQMMPFAEDGDQDCKDAMFENLNVIARMNERIGLLRAEVEGRGLPWTAEGEDKLANGHAEVNGTEVNGTGEAQASVNTVVGGEQPAPRAESGRLTDEELRRQLEAQMEDGEEGVHL